MRYISPLGQRQVAVWAGGPAPPAGAPLPGPSVFAGALLSAALVLLPPSLPPVAAETVRLEDVDAPTLKAALEAATEGRLDAAERLLQIYLREDPSSASAHSNLGNVHLQQGRAAESVEDFNRAIALAPEAPVPYLNRAIAKEQVGLEEAQRGHEATAAELWEEGIADCSRAIELDPKEFAAWFDRGNVRMRLGDYGGALVDFQTAADLAPGLAGYRLRAATLLYQRGDDVDARRAVAGLARKYSNYGEAHAALAAIEWSQGNGAAAEDQLVRATAAEQGWDDIRWVEAHTRWPPRLLQAMRSFLGLKEAEAPPLEAAAPAAALEQGGA